MNLKNNALRTEKDIQESKSANLMDGVDIWTSYYRANPHRFAEEFLRIDLKIYQKIILNMMFKFANTVYIASRGGGKSWLEGVFCVCYAILYPGVGIRIASRNRNQSCEVLKKIEAIVYDEKTPVFLKQEIIDHKVGGYDSFIRFANGSDIRIVSANEGARGNRANVLLVDEYVQVDKDIIDTVLRKFLTVPRMPGYMSNPKYINYPPERNKLQYSSSAYYEDHWSYKTVQDYVENMIGNGSKGSHFCCSIPYHVPHFEGLLDYERVREEMGESGFNEIKFRCEMEGLFWSAGKGGLFSFSDIDKNRNIKYPIFPQSANIKLADKKLFVPEKLPNEKRIISADLALMDSSKNKNDATSVIINRMIPTSKGKYLSNIVYMEGYEGAHSKTQALSIRKLFDEYNCDYLVIDVKGVGGGIVDHLVEDMYDQESGDNYGALSCCNDDSWAKRCSVRSAPKVIWAINGSEKLNTECALTLREYFRQGKVQLLRSELDFESLFTELLGTKAFKNLSLEAQANLLVPYLHTKNLVEELVNLSYEPTGNGIKIKTKQGKRKDIYSSLSYNIYVAKEIEREMMAKSNRTNGVFEWKFTPPKIK